MKCDRLSWDLLVRAVDKELSPSEMAWVPAHIAACPECLQESEAIGGISLNIETMVNRSTVVEHAGDREQLAALKPLRQAPDRVMRRFGWGMAIAATLAIGIIVAPKHRTVANDGPVTEQATAGVSNAIEVDGETFVALPYSNPDLPASAPRIVQMQVPVSSLADIGIALEPVANEILNQDRTVLADVLLGADGQPLGVHVVSWE
jgi:anti-sigma factor RsiW